jgi:RuvB-like protein 1 (pontin 52)
MTPAKILAESQGKSKVTKAEILEINGLFFDAKASARLLQAQSSKYIS